MYDMNRRGFLACLAMTGTAGCLSRDSSNDNPTNRTVDELRELADALVDLTGKSLGAPAAEVLGGRVREEVEFSAYLFYKEADDDADAAIAPGEVLTPEAMVDEARAFVEAHGFETLVDIEGWHPSVPADRLVYSYRVDGGMWTPFMPAETLRVPGLLEGRHVLDVRAKDPNGNVEFTPERVEFTVDSVAPKTRLVGDRVQSGEVSFLADVEDAQTLPEDVRVSWRVDGGDWSSYSYDKRISFKAAAGQHVLEVRAMDEAGNVGTSTLTVAVDESGFGCAIGPADTADGLANLLLALLVPGVMVLARRRRRTR
jgi:hypothetical protein